MCSAASAQTFPNQTVRIINAFPPGGGTDLAVRVVAESMREVLGQPVIVENKPGANTVIAMEEVYKAKADGYTLFASNSTGTSAVLLMRDKLSFNPDKELVMIAPLADGPPSMHVANKNAPFNSFVEMVAYAKANPNKVSFASGGTGATNHLSGELLKGLTGAPMLHVPYKGSAPALVDVIAGNATCMFDILVTSLPQIRGGKVRALAVTSNKRSSYAPDIPTMVEAGVQGYGEAGSDLWFGVLAPAGTPKPVVDRLNAELVKAMRTPEVSERIRAQAYDTWTLSPEEFTAFLRTDYAKWGQVVKLSGAKAD